MEHQAGFILASSEMLTQVRKLKNFIKGAKKRDCTVEVTITEGLIELVIPGAYHKIIASTSGNVKFSIGLMYLIDVLQSAPSLLTCRITPNTLIIGKLSIPVFTTFLKKAKGPRSVNLPVNYTFKDVARLYLSMKNNSEEFQFNNLSKDLEEALARVETDIKKISALTVTYGISKEEVEKMLFKRLIDDGL
jgi:hypothetical protein